MSTDTNTAERAQQTASTAADETKNVASTAVTEARSVASDATQQLRGVVDDTMGEFRTQLDDQGQAQKQKLVETLGGFGDDLAGMAQSGSGLAASVAQEVAGRAKSLSSHLDSREPQELLDDVRRFARNRPGTFLLGALAAGVVAGRLLRGTKDSIEAAQATTPPQTGTDLPTAAVTTTPPTGYATPSSVPPPSAMPPSATGYSSPPVGSGIPSSPASDYDDGGIP